MLDGSKGNIQALDMFMQLALFREKYGILKKKEFILNNRKKNKQEMSKINIP